MNDRISYLYSFFFDFSVPASFETWRTRGRSLPSRQDLAATQASPGSGEAPGSDSSPTMKGPSPSSATPEAEATASGASKVPAVTKEPASTGDQSGSQPTDLQTIEAGEMQVPEAKAAESSSQPDLTQVGSDEGKQQAPEAKASAHPNSDAEGSGAVDQGN